MTGGSVGGGPAVRVTLTHVAFTERGADAVGIRGDATDNAAAAREARVFVPGRVGCGECALCRRGLVAACAAGRTVIPSALSAPLIVEVTDRFLTSIDLPRAPSSESLAQVPSPHAAAAGVVAEMLESAARAGTGPGDCTVWIGGTALAHLGAAWSARRGCRAFQIGGTAFEGVTPLDLKAGPASWLDAIAGSVEGAASRPERKIFVCGRAPSLLQAALALTSPGSTITATHGFPSTVAGLDTAIAVRLLASPPGYHPDLIPEALAAIRRGDVPIAEAILVEGFDSAGHHPLDRVRVVAI